MRYAKSMGEELLLLLSPVVSPPTALAGEFIRERMCEAPYYPIGKKTLAAEVIRNFAVSNGSVLRLIFLLIQAECITEDNGILTRGPRWILND